MEETVQNKYGSFFYVKSFDDFCLIDFIFDEKKSHELSSYFTIDR